MTAAACSRGNSAVPVPVPAPDAPARAACERIAPLLPDSLGKGLSRRETEPESPLVAAWGSPAAVLKCGVPIEQTYKVGDQVIEVQVDTDGGPVKAGWYFVERGDDVVWSNPLATVHVELVVPRKYQGAGLITRLTPAVAKLTLF